MTLFLYFPTESSASFSAVHKIIIYVHIQLVWGHTVQVLVFTPGIGTNIPILVRVHAQMHLHAADQEAKTREDTSA